MTTPRPTKANIFDLYRMATAHYAKLHSDMEMSETFERMEYGALLTGLIDGYSPKIPPTAPVAVQTLVDHVLLGKRPKVTARFASGVHRISEKEKEHLETIEGWVLGAMAKVDRNLTESPRRDFVSQTANPGMGTLVYTLDVDSYPQRPSRAEHHNNSQWRRVLREYEKERDSAFPIDIRSAPPTTILPDPAHEPPHWFIEVRKRQKREFSEIPWLEGTTPYAEGKIKHGWRGQQIEVEELIYCSKDWYAIYLNEKPLLTENEHGGDGDGVAPNPTGKLWYKRAVNGLGKNDRDNRPEYKIIGLLRWAWDTLIMEAEAINQVNMMRGHMASGSWVVSHPNGAETAKKMMRDNPIRIGDITYKDDQLTIDQLVLPVLHPAVLDTLSIVQSLVDLALGASILRGISSGAGDAAAKYRTMLAEARLKFAATRESCQQAEEGMWTDILEMIRDNPETFKDGISVFGYVKGEGKQLTLKPDMIPHGFILEIEYQPVTAEEQAFMMEQGLQLAKGGPNGESLISEYELMTKYMGIENPQREIKERAKDKIRRALWDFAAQVAVQVATQRLQQKLPGLFPEMVMQATPGPNGEMQPVPQAEGTVSAGPGGFTQPGEQPVAPATGTPQDMMRQMNGAATMPPQIAGVR